MSTPDNLDAVELGRRASDHARRRESDVRAPHTVAERPLRRDSDGWLNRWMTSVADLARLKE